MNKRLKTALRIIPVFLLSGVLLVAATRPAVATVPGVNTLVSVDSNGNEGNDHSINTTLYGGRRHMISRDGRFVAFTSKATNLISNDANGKIDVFVRDLESGTTSRVSVSTAGVESNSDTDMMAISETGRYIVFKSTATNLLDGQTVNSTPRIYRHDIKTGETVLLMVSYYGIVSGISNDGRFLALEDMFATYRMHLYEVPTQTLTRLDVPLDGIQQNVDPNRKYSAMSCDGSFIVFESGANNLVTGDTNGQRDIFLADLRNGLKLTNLTAGSDGESRYPEISCNGNYIGFRSTATSLVGGVSSGSNHYYRYDRIDNSFEVLDRLSNGNIATGSAPTDSAPSLQVSDGGDAIFGHRNNMNSTSSSGPAQIYFRNVSAGTTEKLSVTSSGVAADSGVNTPSASANGELAIYSVMPYVNLLGGANAKVGIVLSETGL